MGARPETQSKIEKVKALIDEGERVTKACKQVGLAPSLWHRYGRKVASKPRKSVQNSVEYTPMIFAERTARNVTVVMGSPQDVVEVMKNFNG